MQFLCRILEIFHKICCTGATDIIMNHSDASSSDSPVFFQVLAGNVHHFRASESVALRQIWDVPIHFFISCFFKASVF